MASATKSTDLLDPEFIGRLERLDIVSRRIFAGRMKGERRSKRKGQSVEFADYRNYVVGDDLRFLDWNIYGRLERLFIKLFFEEEDLHVSVLVDTSGSMDFGEPTKLAYAKQLAAALGFVGLVRGDRVKIETLGPGGGDPPPVLRGRRSLWRMLEYLENVQPGGEAPLAQAVKSFCVRNSGKGIVVLISDLMDKSGYEAALRYLLAQEMDIYVIHLLSVAEIEPQLQGDLRLVDCEDGDVAEISVSGPLLKRYRETLAAFIHSARDFCTRRGIVYLAARNDLPVEQLITGYLNQRGLLR